MTPAAQAPGTDKGLRAETERGDEDSLALVSAPRPSDSHLAPGQLLRLLGGAAALTPTVGEVVCWHACGSFTLEHLARAASGLTHDPFPRRPAL